MLTDRATYFTIPDRVYPGSYEPFLDSLLADLRPRIASLRKRFTPYDPSSDRDTGGADLRRSAVEILDQTCIRDKVTLAFALRRLREGQSDVMAVYFRGSDAMQHKFRKYYAAVHDPLLAAFLYDIKDWEKDELGPVIDSYIRFIDESIGRIVKNLDPGTTVIVLSDHDSGYRYDRQIVVRPGALLERLGWTVPGANGIDMNRSRIYGVKDPERADVIRFYANLRGREETGVITPDELDRVLADAASTLRSLRTESGIPLFLEVTPGKSAGRKNGGGDLLARINPDALGGVLSGEGGSLAVSKIASRSPKSGNHRISGILVLSGGDIRKGKRIRGATIYDIVPTLFYLLGLPVAADWVGDPILSAIDGDFVKSHPVRAISTYDDVPFGGRGGPVETEGADEAVRRELRSLGYIQ